MAYKILTKEELKDYAPKTALKALEKKLAARIKALEENQAQPVELEEPAVMKPAEPQPVELEEPDTLPLHGAE